MHADIYLIVKVKSKIQYMQKKSSDRIIIQHYNRTPEISEYNK